MEWYYAVGDESRGPCAQEEIMQLLKNGHIARETPVWHKGMPDWKPLYATGLMGEQTGSPDVDFDAAARAKAGTQAAYAKAREASGHALTAIKVLMVDPMGGQGRAWHLLGPDRGMLAGIFFIALFIAIPSLSALFQGFGTVPLEVKMKFVFFLAMVPGLFGMASWLLSMLVVKKASLKAAVFAMGIAMLPLTIAFALIAMIGFANFEIVIVLTIFAITSFCLLLNAGLTQVHKIPEKIAFWITPLLIVLYIYIVKIIVMREIGSVYNQILQMQ
jgi:hypothetical protein